MMCLRNEIIDGCIRIMGFLFFRTKSPRQNGCKNEYACSTINHQQIMATFTLTAHPNTPTTTTTTTNTREPHPHPQIQPSDSCTATIHNPPANHNVPYTFKDPIEMIKLGQKMLTNITDLIKTSQNTHEYLELLMHITRLKRVLANAIKTLYTKIDYAEAKKKWVVHEKNQSIDYVFMNISKLIEDRNKQKWERLAMARIAEFKQLYDEANHLRDSIYDELDRIKLGGKI